MPARLAVGQTGVLVLAAAVSLVLSAASLYMDDVINNDGVEYLRAAQAILEGDWRAALLIYKWPFYSALIALVSALTGLAAEFSAHLLNAALTALLVVAFIRLVAECGGGAGATIAAAFIILLLPAVNDYRAFVIRDPGYQSFYLLSIIFLLRFQSHRRWADAGAWFAAASVATLFRIEGAVFLLLLPVYMLFTGVRSTRARAMILILAGLLTALLLSAFGWWIFAPDKTLKHMGVVDEPAAIVQGALTQVSTELSNRLEAIRAEFLIGYPGGYAYVVLVLMLLTILLGAVLSNLTLWLAFLVGYAANRRLLFPRPEARTLWYVLIGLNVAILLIFALTKLFLTGRYPLALTLTLLLGAPFGLLALHEAWKARRGRSWRSRWLYPVVVAVIIVAGVEGLDLTTSKGHIKSAGRWLRDHSPATAMLLSNDKLLIYYSDRYTGRYRLESDSERLLDWLRERRGGDVYLAIRVRRHEGDLEAVLVELIGRSPAKVFANDAKDRVLIFAS